MSTLATDLFFFIFIKFNLLSRSAEFLACELLMVPKRGVDILAKDLGIL